MIISEAFFASITIGITMRRGLARIKLDDGEQFAASHALKCRHFRSF
jgi:hypothetical protein